MSICSGMHVVLMNRKCMCMQGVEAAKYDIPTQNLGVRPHGPPTPAYLGGRMYQYLVVHPLGACANLRCQVGLRPQAENTGWRRAGGQHEGEEGVVRGAAANRGLPARDSVLRARLCVSGLCAGAGPAPRLEAGRAASGAGRIRARHRPCAGRCVRMGGRERAAARGDRLALAAQAPNHAAHEHRGWCQLRRMAMPVCTALPLAHAGRWRP